MGAKLEYWCRKVFLSNDDFITITHHWSFPTTTITRLINNYHDVQENHDRPNSYWSIKKRLKMSTVLSWFWKNVITLTFATNASPRFNGHMIECPLDKWTASAKRICSTCLSITCRFLGYQHEAHLVLGRKSRDSDASNCHQQNGQFALSKKNGQMLRRIVDSIIHSSIFNCRGMWCLSLSWCTVNTPLIPYSPLFVSVRSTPTCKVHKNVFDVCICFILLGILSWVYLVWWYLKRWFSNHPP